MTINKTWAMAGAAALVVTAGVVVVALATGSAGTTKARASAPTVGSSALRFVQYDSDKDGRVTRAEVDAGITAQFNAADTIALARQLGASEDVKTKAAAVEHIKAAATSAQA